MSTHEKVGDKTQGVHSTSKSVGMSLCPPTGLHLCARLSTDWIITIR